MWALRIGRTFTTGHPVRARGYCPSWPDRLIAWVRSLDLPCPLFYVLLCLVMFAVLVVLGWIDGSAPIGSFDELPALWALHVTYYLGLLHYLNSVASRALDQFRPALRLRDDQVDRLRAMLTSMPEKEVAVIGVLTVLVTLLALPLSPEMGTERPTLGPLSEAAGTGLTFLANVVIATSVYHSIRQLRLVSRIHRSLTDVSILRREPLYAFSNLTARTGAGFLIGMTIGLFPRSGAAVTSALSVHSYHFLLLLAVAAFVLPIWGIHNLLSRAKQHHLDHVSCRMEALYATLHERIDREDFSDVANVKTSLEALNAQHAAVSKVPTWPWQPGTLAGFLSAILLPLVIWLLQELTRRALGST